MTEPSSPLKQPLPYRQRLYEHYITQHFQQAHDPQHFRKELPFHLRYFRKNYARYLPSSRNASILDVGCGMGHFLFFLQEEGYRDVQGIDLSPEQVDFCLAHQLPAQQADLQTFLQESTERFDCIIFNDVIEHLTKDEIFQTLDLMRENLRKGGTLIIKTPNMANPITAMAGREIDFTHEIGFTETSLRAVLTTIGFQEIALFSPDIYHLPYPFVNMAARLAARTLDKLFFFANALYGRTSLKLFGKNLIAVVQKK